MMMSYPWNNAKLSVAILVVTDIDDPGAVYHAIATRCDPEENMIMAAAPAARRGIRRRGRFRAT